MKLARKLGISASGKSLADFIAEIVSALNAIKGSKGTPKKTAIFTLLKEVVFIASGGTEEEFAEGDDVATFLANFDDESAYQEAILLDAVEENETPSSSGEVDNDFGLNPDGSIKDGYALLPRKSQNDSVVFQWADRDKFTASKKIHWGTAKFRVDSVTMREEVFHKGTPQQYQIVDFKGVLFTDSEPAGLDITLQFNTNYLRRAQSIFGKAHKDGVPSLEGKSLWLNVQVSREVAKETVLESNNPVWVSQAKLAGIPTRKTKSSEFCYVVSRTTSDQYSSQRIMGVVSSDDIQTIKDMIGYRATKTVDVEFEGKSKLSNLNFLDGNVDRILALKAKGFSTGDILAFLQKS